MCDGCCHLGLSGVWSVLRGLYNSGKLCVDGGVNALAGCSRGVGAAFQKQTRGLLIAFSKLTIA